MPTKEIVRATALRGNQVNRPGSNTVRVDPTTGRLMVGAGTSGVVERDAAQDTIVALAADGAIPIAQGAVALTKGSAGAYTLAAPTAAQAGIELTIFAGTAFAHVVTATGLLDDGVTGGSKTTATFAAFVGSSIQLKAYGLKWIVLNKNLVTIT